MVVTAVHFALHFLLRLMAQNRRPQTSILLLLLLLFFFFFQLLLQTQLPSPSWSPFMNFWRW
jgi:TRAP-type C4-dicarboxylate transport system permease small subunit